MKFNFLLKLFICLIFILSFSFFLNLSKVQAAGPSEVVINEVEYDSIQSGTDTVYEWFELYNTTDSPITLSSWTISDAREIDSIPNLTIEAHDFAIVAASENFAENYNPAGLNIVYIDDSSIGNGLGNTGDRLILKDNNGNTIDALSYGSDTVVLNPAIHGVGAGHSIERCPAGLDTNSATDFIDEATPTPGQGVLPDQPPIAEAGPNQNIILGQTVNFDDSSSYDPDGQVVSYYWDFGDGEDCDQSCPSHIYNEVGQFTATLTVTDDSGATFSDQTTINVSWSTYSSNIVINELLPNPAGNESTDEYIEIFNRGSSPIDLSGWKLTDASGSHYIISKKDFANTVIPANGYFVLYREITGIALNNSGGEGVYLYSPDGNQKDSVSYSGSVSEDCSYNRTNSGWQWSATLTPGSGNVITEEDSSNSSSSAKKAKTTKASSTKTSSGSAGSVLGVKKAQAAGNSSSSHHFSENEDPQAVSASDRWRILMWLLMIGAFAGLIVFRLLLWRKDGYKNDTIYQ